MRVCGCGDDLSCTNAAGGYRIATRQIGIERGNGHAERDRRTCDHCHAPGQVFGAQPAGRGILVGTADRRVETIKVEVNEGGGSRVGFKFGLQFPGEVDAPFSGAVNGADAVRFDLLALARLEITDAAVRKSRKVEPVKPGMVEASPRQHCPASVATPMPSE